MYFCTLVSALSLTTPKPSLIFDLITELVPPRGLFLMSPFLIDSSNCYSLCVYKTQASDVEVIVASLEDSALGAMMC